MDKVLADYAHRAEASDCGATFVYAGLPPKGKLIVSH